MGGEEKEEWGAGQGRRSGGAGGSDRGSEREGGGSAAGEGARQRPGVGGRGVQGELGIYWAGLEKGGKGLDSIGLNQLI